MKEDRSFRVVPADDLPEYPLGIEDRLDSHYFMAWERRRWLNSDMRLKGTPECRALYFDLINIAYDQAPVGTVPQDPDTLAKLLMVDAGHFRSLCKLDYGPLHKWTPCICEGGEVRLMHPMVLRSLTEALSRKEDNRAKHDCRAAYQARELAHIERANQLDRARIASERARATLARTLEEKAHADPVSVPRCLGADRVRRLNSLR